MSVKIFSLRHSFFKTSAFLAALLLFPIKSFANPACAVCTIAIGASLEIARKMGVQDCIIGLYAGAMLAVLGYWTIKFFDSKNWMSSIKSTSTFLYFCLNLSILETLSLHCKFFIISLKYSSVLMYLTRSLGLLKII